MSFKLKMYLYIDVLFLFLFFIMYFEISTRHSRRYYMFRIHASRTFTRLIPLARRDRFHKIYVSDNLSPAPSTAGTDLQK